MHLQAKLTLALLPLVSVPVLALGWLAWDNSGEELRRGALLALDMGAMESEQLISDQLAVARANLDLLAASPEVKRYAWTEDTRERHTLRQPSLLKRFHDYRRAYPAYEHLCYLLPDGSVDARAAPPPATDASMRRHSIRRICRRPASPSTHGRTRRTTRCCCSVA